MRLNITLSPEAETKLKERAAARGKDPTAYASEIVEEAVKKPSIDEVLEPLRREFALSGTSDEALVKQIQAAQKAYRKKR